MGIAEFFSGLLMRSVGNNMDNDPQDVRNTKQNLRNAGYLAGDQQELEAPFITRKMDEGIRAFQRDNNLRVDGIMNPSGETERGLFEVLTSQKADDVFGKPTNHGEYVGFGGNVSGTLVPVHDEEPRPMGIGVFSINNDNSVPVPAHKPEVIEPTAKGKELLDFIGKLESGDNYNVIVGGQEKPLTKMTVKEVYALQEKMIDEGKPSSAVGRYQIIRKTLRSAVDKLGVSESSVFDEALQDKLARQLLDGRGFQNYKAGKISTDEFIKKLGDEWASLPKDKSDKSRYEGDGHNRALTKFSVLKDLLEKN